MSLILGMDVGVFLAWIGTILAAVLCIMYGIYHEWIKKEKEINHEEPEQPKENNTPGKKEEEP